MLQIACDAAALPDLAADRVRAVASACQGQDVDVGYMVQLIKGEVVIKARDAEAAMAAIRTLDLRDDVKPGGQ